MSHLPGWIDRIGDYRVEKREGPRSGGQAYLHLDRDPSGCLHTAETSDLDSTVDYLKARYYSPHFVTGEGRIVQMRPLWAQGATLRAHNNRFIQIEAVERSEMSPHLFKPSTLEPTLAVMEFLSKPPYNIPLRRPDDWPDNLGGGTWANNNRRRQSRKALTFHGWVGHVEVPDQDPTWHWDPGSFEYHKAFQLIKEGMDMPLDKDDKTYLESLGRKITADVVSYSERIGREIAIDVVSALLYGRNGDKIPDSGSWPTYLSENNLGAIRQHIEALEQQAGAGGIDPATFKALVKDALKEGTGSTG